MSWSPGDLITFPPTKDPTRQGTVVVELLAATTPVTDPLLISGRIIESDDPQPWNAVGTEVWVSPEYFAVHGAQVSRRR